MHVKGIRCMLEDVMHVKGIRCMLEGCDAC